MKEWTVNPATMLFANLTLDQAKELANISFDGQIKGAVYMDHPGVQAWFAAGNFGDSQRLLTYSSVFLARAALSAAMRFHQEI